LYLWIFFLLTRIDQSPQCLLDNHSFPLDPGRYEFNFCPLQLIPFSGYVDAHTFHHTKNTGNYSLYWAFWDDIMGTNADYKAYVNAQILAENGGDAVAAAESDRSE
jgi:hypothetical protein